MLHHPARHYYLVDIAQLRNRAQLDGTTHLCTGRILASVQLLTTGQLLPVLPPREHYTVEDQSPIRRHNTRVYGSHPHVSTGPVTPHKYVQESLVNCGLRPGTGPGTDTWGAADICLAQE
ncbi:hypothetical protein J6590_003418 [Homalodisca vitripennis]|nr:hypothetical protein J6590_003418 [Homalodisca vitripennis]